MKLWKRQMIENASLVFERSRKKKRDIRHWNSVHLVRYVGWSVQHDQGKGESEHKNARKLSKNVGPLQLSSSIMSVLGCNYNVLPYHPIQYDFLVRLDYAQVYECACNSARTTSIQMQIYEQDNTP